MEANELRVGNFVTDEQHDEVLEVFNIYRSYVRVYIDNELEDLQVYYDYLKPIPLTEEWLLKFGFEKYAHSFICDKFHITKQYNSDYWFSAFNKNNALINKIKYVHQLQNLYFALTNDELKYI